MTGNIMIQDYVKDVLSSHCDEYNENGLEPNIFLSANMWRGKQRTTHLSSISSLGRTMSPKK